MPSGIYVRKPITEEARKNMSLAAMGKKYSEEYKRNMSSILMGNKNALGYKQSEKTKRNMSLAAMGNTNSLGYKQSEEHKLKMSEAHKGEKSSLWKGGITPINALIRNGLDYRQWRTEVFERDDYTCQDCGVRGGKLHAHHIKSFSQHPELRFEISNGLTLCKNCHRQNGYHNGLKKKLQLIA